MYKRKHQIDKVTAPYLLDENDPYKKKKKVLKTEQKPAKIKGHKRKDNDMRKNKKQIKGKQIISILILAVFAVIGIAEILGGHRNDYIISAITGALLLNEALDII